MALNPFIPNSGSTHLSFRTQYNANMSNAESRIASLESSTGSYATTGHQHVVADITDIAANYQPLDAVLTNTTASFTTGDEAKLDHITVTQPVDLDAIEAASGDMLAATYDPTNVSGDAFDMDNMVEGDDTKILTSGERNKLSGIASGAEVNVNADWDAVGGDAEILNKPTLGTMAAADTGSYSPTGHTHSEYAATSHTHTVTDINSAATPSGYVITADGSGNATWEEAQGGGAAKFSVVTVTTPTYTQITQHTHHLYDDTGLGGGSGSGSGSGGGGACIIVDLLDPTLHEAVTVHKKIGNDCDVLLLPPSGCTIDGVTGDGSGIGYTLTSQYESISIFSDGVSGYYIQ